MKTSTKSFTILLLFVATLMISTSCFSPRQEPTSKTPAEKLIEVIELGIDSGVIMLGHQDDPLYGHSWKYEENRSDILEVVGDYPAVMGWEIGGLELGNDKSLDGVPFDLLRSEIIKQHNRGGINTISWHTFNPFGGDSWDEEAGVVSSILKGGKNYDMFQGWLSTVAKYLGSIKDESGELIPIIFRPWHEHDGDWFWWGESWCTHAEYVELWDMTYEFMEGQGLNNLVWCYMPVLNAEDKTPSADRFDMLGLDQYQQKEDVEGYLKGLRKKLDMLVAYRTKYNKPIAITETGSEGIPVEGWWSEVLLPAISNDSISYVLLWRNAWDKPEHFYSAYKGHKSEADFVKFVDSKQVVTVKEIEKNITKTLR